MIFISTFIKTTQLKSYNHRIEQLTKWTSNVGGLFANLVALQYHRELCVSYEHRENSIIASTIFQEHLLEDSKSVSK